MSKSVLIVANVAKEHINKFHIPTIKMLTGKGYDVDVACRLDEPVPYCRNTYDLPCDRNPFKGGLIKSVSMLKKIISENGYDIVHCHTVTGSIVARFAAMSFRKKGLKVIYSVHGMHFFKGAPISRWIMGWPVEKLLSHFTDVLITINDEDFTYASSHLKAIKSVKKINGIGVDLKRFSQSERKTEREYRESLGLTDSDIALIYVAELNDNKNQESLIRVLGEIKESKNNVKLVLVGPDHYDGKLQSIAQELGLGEDVVFTGWRNDVPQLLHGADIAVASSKSEGLPLNLIEAMASGLPVIAYDNRGHRSVIKDGFNGRIVPLNDEKAMAAAVIKAINDPDLRQNWVNNAKAEIVKYDKSNVLKQIESIYEEVNR